MARNKHELKIAIFEDGTHTVLSADPGKPHLLEMIATFHDAARARDYVRSQNAHTDEHQEEQAVTKQFSTAKPKQASRAKPKQPLAAESKQASKAEPKKVSEAKLAQASASNPRQANAAKPKAISKADPNNVATDVTERQTAVLKALRSLMDKKNRVEVRAGELAKAASIPLGSLHSVLASLEKKQMIRTERQGTVQAPAVYEVLETSRKSPRALNGGVHSKEAGAAAH